MPAVGRAEPNIQAQEEVINQVNKAYDELKQVYSKKALDETFEHIFTACKRMEEDNQEMRAMIEKLQIQVINVSPFTKFVNLFRRG